ncbi:MAG: DUF1566 domain-containing protein, partial [Desulfuromonadales bacterium]|nr:DUF1566 domain-containing protein [Desulfuromonadales bacterium]
MKRFVLFFVLILLPSGLLAASIDLPETGQTSCWDDTSQLRLDCQGEGVGQDAAVAAGLALPSPRYVDNSNGTVKDNLTGLVWLKHTSCFGLQTWAEALDSANRLWGGSVLEPNLRPSCNLYDGSRAGDWRVPNVNEMASLDNAGADYFRFSLESKFGYVKAQFTDKYWTSTTDAQDPDEAWSASIISGMVLLQQAKTNTGYAWFVRDGSPDDGIVSLPATGQTSCFEVNG